MAYIFIKKAEETLRLFSSR